LRWAAVALSLCAWACHAPSAHHARRTTIRSCDYQVTLDADGRAVVQAACEADGPMAFALAERYLRSSVKGPGGARARSFAAPSGRLRYEVDLARLALRKDFDRAQRLGDSFVGTVSSLLLVPEPLTTEIPVTLRIAATPPLAVSVGLRRGQAPGQYELMAHEIPVATYFAFGKLEQRTLDIAGGKLELTRLDAPLDASLDASLLSPGPQALASFNVTWVQQLKDDSEFRRLAAQLKQKLLPTIREATLTEDGPGFSLRPRSAQLPVSLRVKFFDKHLFITAGGNPLCDRAEGAFSKGDRTLKDDAAHQAALGALPEKHHFRMWLDTGRLADTLFKNPLVRAKITENGVQLDKFRMTGPQRVTSGLTMTSNVENEVWTYRIDALNMQALAPLGLGAASLGGLSGGLGAGRTGLPAL